MTPAPQRPRRIFNGLLAASIPLLLMSSNTTAQSAVQAPARTRHTARGRFVVQMKPQADSGFEGGNAKLGRLSLDKTFEGDLVATGQGEMLTALTQTQGSAGYVALERVTGRLHGRPGSFVLQHSGRMDRGAQQLEIAVVADSGSGDLVGLEGTLRIRVEAGQHFYEFEYTLPDLLQQRP